MKALTLLLATLSLPALAQTAPAGWLLKQEWKNISFAHYEVDPAEIQKKLPRGLTVDLHEGKAYLGVVTLKMNDGRLNGINLPLYRPFTQVNMRTYVKCGKERGIYFFSIHAGHLLGSIVAKSYLNLPYKRAKVKMTSSNGVHLVRSEAAEKSYDIIYSPKPERVSNDPRSLEMWLTDITQSFQVNKRGKIEKMRVWHAPFEVYKANAQIANDDLITDLGVRILSAPSVHFSKQTTNYSWDSSPISCD